MTAPRKLTVALLALSTLCALFCAALGQGEAQQRAGIEGEDDIPTAVAWRGIEGEDDIPALAWAGIEGEDDIPTA